MKCHNQVLLSSEKRKQVAPSKLMRGEIFQDEYMRDVCMPHLPHYIAVALKREGGFIFSPHNALLPILVMACRLGQ